MTSIGNYPFTAQVRITSSLSTEGQNTLLPELTIRSLMVFSLQREQAMYMPEKQCLQEMPSSVISAILQEHDITFTVTSSMIRTFHSADPFPFLAACSISCRRRSRDIWRKVRNPPLCEESESLMFAFCSHPLPPLPLSLRVSLCVRCTEGGFVCSLAFPIPKSM
jgi:hypothetical protein